jgi:hypothetical protein
MSELTVRKNLVRVKAKLPQTFFQQMNIKLGRNKQLGKIRSIKKLHRLLPMFFQRALG